MLELILFIIYLNDVKNSVISEKLTCYSDDVALFFKENYWSNVFNGCEIGINKLKVWLHENRLSVNVTKTKFVHFGLYHSHSLLKITLCYMITFEDDVTAVVATI